MTYRTRQRASHLQLVRIFTIIDRFRMLFVFIYLNEYLTAKFWG